MFNLLGDWYCKEKLLVKYWELNLTLIIKEEWWKLDLV